MRYDRIQRTLGLVLVLNLLVAAAKATVGLMAGSVSMVADSLHSLFDSLSNIVGIVSTHFARQPPDQIHPYGHSRFETAGTLVIGAMLLLSAFWIISEGVGRFFTREAPEITGLTVGVMVATILINLLVTTFERRMGEELQSQILLADARHTASDILVSLSVLGGFAAVLLGYPIADPLIALGIGILIGRMGLAILKEAANVLTDAVVVDCEDRIAMVLSSIEGVRGYHDFRCRGKPHELFADIHITVDPHLSVVEGHAIAEEVMARIRSEVEEIEDVVVHVDPDDQRGEEEA
ncbi:MAG TPA: cation transporter [Methanoculleus sp.]|nr:cation transporter [Methanoculleus sp.]